MPSRPREISSVTVDKFQQLKFSQFSLHEKVTFKKRGHSTNGGSSVSTTGAWRKHSVSSTADLAIGVEGMCARVVSLSFLKFITD